MTKKVIAGSLALLAVTAMYAQTYQLPNVGFENWENAKGIIHASSGNALSTSGKCPTSWFVPNIAYSADVSSLNAAKLGIRRFTTTLAGSRWKRLDQIREAALEAAALHPGTTYWDQNWRKGGLQERRGEILREENFYNQLWCGCEFSMGHLRERDPSDLPAHMKPYLEALGLTGKG